MNKKDKIKELRNQGKTYRQIAKSLNISPQRVGQVLTPENRLFRYWTEDSCIYAGLRKWLNDNKVTMKQLLTLMGYVYHSGTIERYRQAFNGKTALKLDAAIKLKRITGKSLDELFDEKGGE